MAAFWGILLLFLIITDHSSAATYCVCKDGMSESALQKNIDYACGAGASCSAILEKGVCYNPNTVKDHCNYAVNSYFQNKGQAVGSCDFMGTAVTTQSVTSQSSTCVYPTSASSGNTQGTGTSTGTGTGTTTSTGTNTGATFGLGPSSNVDTSKATTTHQIYSHYLFFWLFTLSLFLLKP